jgi:peptidyl-prolyl cis-trans isomerase C
MLARRRAIVPCLLVFALACAGDPDAHREGEADSSGPTDSHDRVLAEVNGSPVLARQVDRIREADRLRLGAEGRTDAELDPVEIRRRGLQLAINAELCLQAARAEGMTVSDAEIDEQIASIRSQFATEEDFDRYLDEAGVSEKTLRSRAERRILVESYVRTITDTLVLDEDEAQRIYGEQKDSFRDAGEVRAAQIIVRVLPDAPAERRAVARRKIDEPHARLEAGEDFAEIAREYSESPFASRGGDLGFFPRGRALPEFEAVVFETPVGRTTSIFETAHGFNIVKVLDRREAGINDFEEVKTALMMVLAREQQDTRLREHIEELRAGATIRVLDAELAGDDR